MLTTGKEGTFKIFNALTQTCVRSVAAHTASISKAIWSGENYIYTCSQDKLIRVWKEDGTNISTLRGHHAHWINTMSLNSEFLLRTGPFDEKKIEFNSFSDKVEYSFKRYHKFKESMRMSTENNINITSGIIDRIVTGSDDFTLLLWEPISSPEKYIAQMTGHQGLVNHVQFSPDNLFIASASFDKCIKMWNGYTGAFLYNLRGHIAPVYQIAWSADSKYLLSGSKDSTLKVWNIKSDKKDKSCRHDLPGHADEVYCVDWSPDGLKAASGSKDKRVNIWKN